MDIADKKSKYRHDVRVIFELQNLGHDSLNECLLNNINTKGC